MLLQSTAVTTRTASLTRSLADAALLCQFVEIWCEGQHATRERVPWEPPGVLGNAIGDQAPVLCDECRRTLGYALGRRLLCQHDPKPACKHCDTPCYRDEHRVAMRRIMRYSGIRLILRGRFDLIFKYFF